MPWLFFLLVTPKFTNSPPQTKTINEGEDLTLNCAATGTPTPNITWVQILNSGNVTKNEGIGSSTLIIPNIQRPGGSSGKYVYECQAKNNPNEPAVTKRTELIVNCKYKRMGVGARGAGEVLGEFLSFVFLECFHSDIKCFT